MYDFSQQTVKIIAYRTPLYFICTVIYVVIDYSLFYLRHYKAQKLQFSPFIKSKIKTPFTIITKSRTMKAIQISIIEDVEEYRTALQIMLNSTPGFECTQTYSNGEAAVRDIPKHQPDIVLVDINLPRMSGIQVMERLKKEFPKIQFMVLTVFEDDEKIFNALSAGASGYLLKSTPTNKIMEAIRELHDGGSPMSTSIARKVVASFRMPTNEFANPYEQLLTLREKEVLEMLSQGKLYRQISEELFITMQTVKSHCHNIYEKLHVTTKTEAINKVYPRG